jgi:hypothetical protein
MPLGQSAINSYLAPVTFCWCLAEPGHFSCGSLGSRVSGGLSGRASSSGKGTKISWALGPDDLYLLYIKANIASTGSRTVTTETSRRLGTDQENWEINLKPPHQSKSSHNRPYRPKRSRKLYSTRHGPWVGFISRDCSQLDGVLT